MPAGDPFTYAQAAQENLEKLATELARAGADDDTVDAISEMATAVNQVVSVLGEGQQTTGDDEPAEAPPQNYDEAAAQTSAMMQEAEAARQ
jgi:hypothetical protein